MQSLMAVHQKLHCVDCFKIFIFNFVTAFAAADLTFEIIDDQPDFLVLMGRGSVDCNYGIRDPYAAWAPPVEVAMCARTYRCAELEGPSTVGDGAFVSYKAGCEDICPKKLPPGYRCRLCHANYCNLKLQTEIVYNSLRCFSALKQPFRVEDSVAFFCSRDVQHCYIRLAATKDRIFGGCFRANRREQLCSGPEGVGACEFCATHECNKPSGLIKQALEAHGSRVTPAAPTQDENSAKQPSEIDATDSQSTPVPKLPAPDSLPSFLVPYTGPELELTDGAVPVAGGSPHQVLLLTAIAVRLIHFF